MDYKSGIPNAEELKKMSEILISGGEISRLYNKKEYKLRIFGKVPEWFETETGRIAPCRTQNGIYEHLYETNQDEFWGVFEETRGRFKEVEHLATKIRKRQEMLLQHLKSNYSNGGIMTILSGKGNLEEVYEKMGKPLLKTYGKNPLGKIESDIKTLKGRVIFPLKEKGN